MQSVPYPFEPLCSAAVVCRGRKKILRSAPKLSLCLFEPISVCFYLGGPKGRAYVCDLGFFAQTWGKSPSDFFKKPGWNTMRRNLLNNVFRICSGKNVLIFS